MTGLDPVKDQQPYGVDSMSKFGAGFGKDTVLLQYRPCRTTQSVSNQRHFNRRLETDLFSGASFPEPRPTWWRNESNDVFRVPSPSRLGEWRLVWKKAGGESEEQAGASIRAGSGPAWADADALYESGMAGPHLGGYVKTVASRGPTSASIYPGRSAVGSPRRRAHSSLGIAGEHEMEGADLNLGGAEQGTGRLNLDVLRKRQGTAASRCANVGVRQSTRSRACTELSHTSTASITSSAIVDRIRNLEDAIKSEKTLRVKMQSMLELSAQGLGSRTPPGGWLPALREGY